MPRPVFLAAPERGLAAQGLIESMLRELQVASGGALRGSHVFVPHLQVGDVGVETDAATYFSRSLGAIQEARAVVAVLDGPQVDDNVAFWMGYAFAAGKPVLALASDGLAKAAMPTGACLHVATGVRALADALAPILAGASSG